MNRDRGQNGAGRTASTPEPTNVYGLAWHAVERFGPWALVALALMAWLFYQDVRHERFARESHALFHESLRENVKAPLQDLATEQREANGLLNSINTRLELHVDTPTRHSR